jgi:hypothetical protein
MGNVAIFNRDEHHSPGLIRLACSTGHKGICLGKRLQALFDALVGPSIPKLGL